LKPFVTRKSPMVAAIHVERQDCFAPLGWIPVDWGQSQHFIAYVE
jgi:hypothetical protein